MKNIFLLLFALILNSNAKAFFFFIPLPNLAKPTALQALIDSYEKEIEPRAIAFAYEDKTFGSKNWIWGQSKGQITDEEANYKALRQCEVSLNQLKRQMVGEKYVYDFGNNKCQLYEFQNKIKTSKQENIINTQTYKPTVVLCDELVSANEIRKNEIKDELFFRKETCDGLQTKKTTVIGSGDEDRKLTDSQLCEKGKLTNLLVHESTRNEIVNRKLNCEEVLRKSSSVELKKQSEENETLTTKRLKEIQNLLDKNLITKEEYEKKRKEIIESI